MKTLFTISTLLLGCLSAPAQTAGKQADSRKLAEAQYQRGLAAEKQGDPAGALVAYRAALQLYPKHAEAQYRAGQVKINATSMIADATEEQIGRIVLPDYRVEEVTVAEAIEVLGLAMEKVTKSDDSTNFILEDPKGKLADARISMQLKNIPVKAVLDYIHAQANTKARYDPHAVVISAR